MIRQLIASYKRWAGRAEGRFSGWSTRRRYLVFVLVPLLFCCCGGVVLVPVVWVIRMTAEASKAAPSPDAAANIYLLGLSYGNEEGLLPVLEDDQQDELLAQWRTYLAAMKGTQPPPFKLNFGSLTVDGTGQGKAEVTTYVSAEWSSTDSAGRLSGYSSSALRWTFETVQTGSGWQVSKVSAPAWCGEYVLAEKCTTR